MLNVMLSFLRVAAKLGLKDKATARFLAHLSTLAPSHPLLKNSAGKVVSSSDVLRTLGNEFGDTIRTYMKRNRAEFRTVGSTGGVVSKFTTSQLIGAFIDAISINFAKIWFVSFTTDLMADAAGSLVRYFRFYFVSKIAGVSSHNVLSN